MSDFFVMECHGQPPLARVSMTTDMGSLPWMSGMPVEAPEEVLTYKVHKDKPGNLRAMYGQLAVPLIRSDLLAQLQAVGVDNLQLFSAVIRDAAKGLEHKDYFAFNILGKVAAADMGKSKLMHPHSLTGVDHDFASLEFAKNRIGKDLLLFRLAESVNAIVVHERVKERVEQSGIKGMVFYASGEWSG